MLKMNTCLDNLEASVTTEKDALDYLMKKNEKLVEELGTLN